jgi:hypothetical protein
MVNLFIFNLLPKGDNPENKEEGMREMKKKRRRRRRMKEKVMVFVKNNLIIHKNYTIQKIQNFNFVT